jgi:hypothetical protein
LYFTPALDARPAPVNVAPAALTYPPRFVMKLMGEIAVGTLNIVRFIPTVALLATDMNEFAPNASAKLICPVMLTEADWAATMATDVGAKLENVTFARSATPN